MLQQGQLFQLKTSGSDGKPLWAYRYRVGGRRSKRVQRGGFQTEDDAREALERPRGAAARPRLSEHANAG